ncbi:putative exported protein [Vibrio ponticus]|nr:putative exported protein [Vibrio ponticus]
MVTDQTRRTLLKAALFGAAAPMLPFGCAGVVPTQPCLVGCALNGRDRYSVVVANEAGGPIHQLPLPERGHGVAVNATLGHAVAFARRPGSYLMVFDYISGEMLHLIKAAPSRHYYGHGVYSNDGKLLFATEGERATSRGIIGVYDVTDGYKKLTEFSGFGLGPHEVIIMPDDRLVIGVGGVHTDGRTPLNLASMQPSLSYLSSQGDLLEQLTLGDHHLSIRHLAHDGDETVLCGQQYRGEPDEYPSLLAMHKPGEKLTPLQAEPEQWARFNHYIASIAATTEWILATSPRGNCYGIWSKATGKLVELSALPDASGVVAQDDLFSVSSGSGQVISQSQPKDKTSFLSGVQWDNHWNAIG